VALPADFGACAVGPLLGQTRFLGWDITETHEAAAEHSCRLHSTGLETEYNNFLRR
jgi:hypothetical protein